MIAPLNLEYLLINVFSGNTLVFIGVALIAIAIMSARFRFPNIIFAMVIGLFGIVIASLAGWLYMLILIVVGIGVGYTVTRFVR